MGTSTYEIFRGVSVKFRVKNAMEFSCHLSKHMKNPKECPWSFGPSFCPHGMEIPLIISLGIPWNLHGKFHTCFPRGIPWGKNLDLHSALSS